MPAKVFISCGQSSEEEIRTAKELEEWFKGKGYQPYVAKQAQSIYDVNRAIIEELESADYYVFIDFKREQLNSGKYGGSLFTHQELALAYYLGFDNVILLQQEGVVLEGFLKYVLGNSVPFRSHEDAVSRVKEEVPKRWSPDFSRRRLPALGEKPEEPGIYQDHTGIWLRYWRGLHIHNKSKTRSASNVIAVLLDLKVNGKTKEDTDRTALKWAGQRYSAAVIPPGLNYSFDAFAVAARNPSHVYLHSVADLHPRRPIIEEAGEHHLTYLVHAEGFPQLIFTVKLTLTGNWQTIEAEILPPYGEAAPQQPVESVTSDELEVIEVRIPIDLPRESQDSEMSGNSSAEIL